MEFFKLSFKIPYFSINSISFQRILFPGGGTWFNQTNGYAEAGAHIYDIAVQMNENGAYFPLFGTCLGFELLLFLSNGKQEYRTTCSSQRQRSALNFTKGKRSDFHFFKYRMHSGKKIAPTNSANFLLCPIDFRESRLFGGASIAILNVLQNEAVTSNFHSWCLTKQVKFLLTKLWI